MKSFIHFLKSQTILAETVHTLQPANGSIHAEDFYDLLNSANNREHRFVKVLKRADHTLKVYNIRNEFNFSGTANSDIRVEYHTDYHADNQTTMAQLHHDFRAIHNAADVEDSILKVYNSSSTETNEDFLVYYDDRTDIAFICLGLDLDDVADYIDNLVLLMQRIDGDDVPESTSVHLDNDHIEAAIEHYHGSIEALSQFAPFVSRQLIQDEVGNQAAQQVQGIDPIDVDQIQDVIDAFEQPQAENPQHDRAQGDDEDDDTEDDEPVPVHPADDEDDNGEDEDAETYEVIKNVNLAGEIQQNDNLGAYDFVFSRESYDEFKETLRSGNYPPERVNAIFTNRPVKFKKIHWERNTDGLFARLTFVLVHKNADGSITLNYPMAYHGHPLAQSMDVPTELVTQMQSGAVDVWQKAFKKVWFNQYNGYHIRLNWDRDNVGSQMKTTTSAGRNTNHQQNAQPRNNATDAQIQDQQPRQPRQRRQADNPTPEGGLSEQQITQIEQNAKQILSRIDIDANMIIYLGPHSVRNTKIRGLPSNGHYLVFEFPGVEHERFIGDAAKTFLQELGLWDNKLQPIFEQIQQQIQDIQPVVKLDGVYFNA